MVIFAQPFGAVLVAETRFFPSAVRGVYNAGVNVVYRYVARLYLKSACMGSAQILRIHYRGKPVYAIVAFQGKNVKVILADK